MEQLLSLKTALNLPRIGPAKSLWLGVVAAMVLALVGFVAMRSSGQMGLLYAGLDPAEAGKIAQRLDELKVAYQAKGDGGTILVPEAEVGRVRMELAAAGLPHQSGAGYELLDNQSPMNMTSFMQRVQRTRALEGELARTIASLNGVRSARVHLVLPEREGFSRETPQPRASVSVIMDGPGRLSTSQAAAVRLLVAGAVPRLRQEDVSVLDPSGVVLAADGGAAFAMNRIDEMRTTNEQELQRTVTNLLAPLVGAGKVRVAASVDLEAARETQREEKFDPLSQVERSRQSQNDRETSEDSRSPQPVTVGQNVPNQQAGGGNTSKNSNQSSHTGETINYEISSTVSERVREPGELKRMTVAVVVDGTTDAKGHYVPRSQDELDRLKDLVRSAVGYDAKRGDQITVQSMHFAPVDELGTSSDGAALAQAGGLPLKMIIPAAAGALLVGAGAVFFLMRRRAKPLPEVLPPAEATRLGLAEQPEDLFSIAAVGGTPRSPVLQQLHNLVDDRPDEALAVLRGWITEGATT